jgi:MscS family membrane protein
MVVTIILLFLWGPVLAAEQATVENKAAQPTSEVPVDEFGRGSPRGTVNGYLEACREGDYKKASNYLDLRRIPGGGPTLARKLRTVLSRTLWVDVETLSQDHKGTANDGLPSYRDRLGTIDITEGKVDILLQRVPRGDGVSIWKIAGVTVSQVPDLYAEFGYGVLERFLPKFFFDIQFLDIALWQWIGLLVLVLLAAVTSWLLAVVVVRTIGALVARTKTSIDDRLFEVSVSPIRLAIAVLFFELDSCRLAWVLRPWLSSRRFSVLFSSWP